MRSLLVVAATSVASPALAGLSFGVGPEVSLAPVAPYWSQDDGLAAATCMAIGGHVYADRVHLGVLGSVCSGVRHERVRGALAVGFKQDLGDHAFLTADGFFGGGPVGWLGPDDARFGAIALSGGPRLGLTLHRGPFALEAAVFAELSVPVVQAIEGTAPQRAWSMPLGVTLTAMIGDFS